VKPSITHTQGFLDDCNDATSWVQHDGGLGGVLTVENDDYFKISGTPNAVGDEYTYYERNITDISTDLYPKLVVRWKTDAITNGLRAIVDAVYTVGPTTSTALGFSTGWKTIVIDLTPAKTLSTIQLWADDYPDTAESYGAHWVAFDFILACGLFTFPNCAGGLHFTPPSRHVASPIPSRLCDVTQFLGTDSATVESTSNLDIGNWKRSTDSVNGDVFLDVAHNSYKEPWQWLDTGTERFKVTLDRPVFRREVNGSRTQHMIDLTFREFRRSNGNLETFRERFHSEGQL